MPRVGARSVRPECVPRAREECPECMAEVCAQSLCPRMVILQRHLPCDPETYSNTRACGKGLRALDVDKSRTHRHGDTVRASRCHSRDPWHDVVKGGSPQQKTGAIAIRDGVKGADEGRIYRQGRSVYCRSPRGSGPGDAHGKALASRGGGVYVCHRSTGPRYKGPLAKKGPFALMRHTLERVGVQCNDMDEWVIRGERALAPGNHELAVQAAQAAAAARWRKYSAQRTALRGLEKGRDEETTAVLIHGFRSPVDGASGSEMSG